MKLLAILILAGLALVGCTPSVEGVVVGKDVDPGRTESYWTTERQACGTESYTTTRSTASGAKEPVTRTRTRYCDNRVQRSRNVPPSWDLFIRTDQGETKRVGVSRAMYSVTKIGERVNTARMP